MNKEQEFIVAFEGFSGPFDLLLHLIDEEKVDLYDIKISTITAAYLKHIEMMDELNLNIAAEFIYMASFLIELKSKMLIPNSAKNIDLPDDIESDRAGLLEKLVEYKMFKTLSGYLTDQQQDFSLRHTREYINQELSKTYIVENPSVEVTNGDVLNLVKAFNRTLKRFKESQKEYFTEIQPQLFSVREKMEFIVDKIFSAKIAVSFTEILQSTSTHEMIASFLAILELYKEGILGISQSDLFDDIEIVPITRKDFEFNDSYYNDYDKTSDSENQLTSDPQIETAVEIKSNQNEEGNQ